MALDFKRAANSQDERSTAPLASVWPKKNGNRGYSGPQKEMELITIKQGQGISVMPDAAVAEVLEAHRAEIDAKLVGKNGKARPWFRVGVFEYQEKPDTAPEAPAQA